MNPEPDRSESERIPVVAAVIRRGESVLVARRPSHKRHGGLWEFPGGKVLPGETALEAARRELSEELGVQVVELGPMLFSAPDPDSAFVIHFHEVAIQGDPVSHEHDELRWAAIPELLALPFAPVDQRFVVQHLT